MWQIDVAKQVYRTIDSGSNIVHAAPYSRKWRKQDARTCLIAWKMKGVKLPFFGDFVLDSNWAESQEEVEKKRSRVTHNSQSMHSLVP